jgi:hypothetical protein
MNFDTDSNFTDTTIIAAFNFIENFVAELGIADFNEDSEFGF